MRDLTANENELLKHVSKMGHWQSYEIVRTESKEYDLYIKGASKDSSSATKGTTFISWLPLATLSVMNWAAPDIWELNNAYGVKGFTPPGGPDWSGIRDSSTETIWKMFDIALWRLGIKKRKGPEMTKGHFGR
jgi:hypothetical protein